MYDICLYKFFLNDVLVANFNHFITRAFLSTNASARASRKSSSRVNNKAVQKAVSELFNFLQLYSARLDAQQKKLNLPILPTTTIGSLPQIIELKRVLREYKAKKISEEDYVSAIKEEINKVVKLQEELDIDVLVHGEPEQNGAFRSQEL
ncbi:5-methyltetrahydropteroyltriglutamate--homocysteine methyltransferase-like isoform X1 [Apium graveolens]|uniref:5-methyltetrahydropteroyltriglutamate-- homocysteine methyltransferase-like isoform X1 n=1 Tax=Apium graveolens TaxID=4045 RepID=UPI003D7B4C59